MAAAAGLLAPNVAFQALPPVETKLRTKYLFFAFDSEIEGSVASPEPRVLDEVVRTTARVLELVLVSACTKEILEDLGADSMQTSGRPREFFVDRVKELTGLNPLLVVRDALNARLVKKGPSSSKVDISLSAVVRSIRAWIEGCPIDEIEMHANSRGLEAWGNRCRVAYDALRAFAVRNDSREKSRVAILGREYVSGSLSISEVATLLNLEPMDAVAVLEQLGYSRPLEKIVLSDNARNQKFAKIREDRLRRAGRFEPKSNEIERDVIASERLEGIDARRWVKP